MTVLAML